MPLRRRLICISNVICSSFALTCSSQSDANPCARIPKSKTTRVVRRFLLASKFMLTAALFLSQTSTAQQPPAPSPLTLVKASRMLDPRTGNVLSPAAVLIEAGKVRAAGTPAQVQADSFPGVTTIDLGNATLLPGLIDSHTHLLLDVVLPPEAESHRHLNGAFAPGLLLAVVESPSKRALVGAQLAHEDLESGITTVRNLHRPFPASTATPSCATPSTQAASLAQESSLPDGSSSREANTFKT